MCSNCVSIYSVSKVLFCKVPTKVSTHKPSYLPTFYPSLLFSQSAPLLLLLSSSHMLNKDVQDYFTLYRCDLSMRFVVHSGQFKWIFFHLYSFLPSYTIPFLAPFSSLSLSKTYDCCNIGPWFILAIGLFINYNFVKHLLFLWKRQILRTCKYQLFAEIAILRMMLHGTDFAGFTF